MKNKEQFKKGAKINGIQTTVLSINSIIHNFDGLISLNRISTNPLEHRFGLMRDMSNYKHAYDTFIKMEIKNLIMKDIEKMSYLIWYHQEKLFLVK